MKQFTKIHDKFISVRRAGYKFDPNAERETDFSEIFDGLDYYEREDRIDDEIDCFCDLDCAELCIDEKGDLYAVQFYWTGKHIIWRKVIKEED